MKALLESAAAAMLRRLDPETAHRVAVGLLRCMTTPAAGDDPPELAIEAFGLRFPNPVGLAAGFDKDATVASRAAALGFGFVEVGTLTPRPQSGNPRPRVFRLTKDHAVINRYGFNNGGHAAAHARLAAHRPGGALAGVNIGANKDSTDRTADYVAGIARFADVADYFVLNVSSPNTPGLRDLQAAAALDDLLARCLAARDAATDRHGRRPVLLKIAPDLEYAALDDIVTVARRRMVDGMIVSNTTVGRPPGLRDAAQNEAGGLSGRPLFALSTRMLAETFVRTERAFPLIGVGGIDDADGAWAKVRAGATLVQLYSGLIFAGPGLVRDIKRGFVERLHATGSTLEQNIGADADLWIKSDRVATMSAQEC